MIQQIPVFGPGTQRCENVCEDILDLVGQHGVDELRVGRKAAPPSKQAAFEAVLVHPRKIARSEGNRCARHVDAADSPKAKTLPVLDPKATFAAIPVSGKHEALPLDNVQAAFTIEPRLHIDRLPMQLAPHQRGREKHQRNEKKARHGWRRIVLGCALVIPTRRAEDHLHRVEPQRGEAERLGSRAWQSPDAARSMRRFSLGCSSACPAAKRLGSGRLQELHERRGPGSLRKVEYRHALVIGQVARLRHDERLDQGRHARRAGITVELQLVRRRVPERRAPVAIAAIRISAALDEKLSEIGVVLDEQVGGGREQRGAPSRVLCVDARPRVEEQSSGLDHVRARWRPARVAKGQPAGAALSGDDQGRRAIRTPGIRRRARTQQRSHDGWNTRPEDWRRPVGARAGDRSARLQQKLDDVRVTDMSRLVERGHTT